MQKRVTALYRTSLMYTLSTMFQNNVQIQLFQKKLKPNLNKSNKHNISIHLKQVSKQPVVTLGTLKLPSLKMKICLHLLFDGQCKNYFIGQASRFSFVKSSKFGILSTISTQKSEKYLYCHCFPCLFGILNELVHYTLPANRTTQKTF